MHRKRCVRKHRLADETVRAKVEELLMKDWSPEQITHRLKVERSNLQIGFATIYRAVDNGLISVKCKKRLRTKGRQRFGKKGKSRCGQLPVSKTIHERPKEANERSRLGDWESDTVRGAFNSGCVATHVDRKSRITVLIKIPNRTTKAYMDATIHYFSNMPKDARKTFTTDHGKEFADYRRLTNAFGCEVYFADPGCPGQRGTNENTNGLLRQYLPKRMRFDRVTQKDLTELEQLLNTRPRKCLDWKTPYEVFYDRVLHLT